MVKLTALYKKPNDVQEFDRYYREVHTPIAKKLPGLKKLEVAQILGSPMGDSPYHLIADLYFDSMDDLKNAMSSPEGKASAKDLGNFANGLVQMMICEVK